MSEANMKVRVVIKEANKDASNETVQGAEGSQTGLVADEYEYRWGRIILLLLIGLVLAFIVFKQFSGYPKTKLDSTKFPSEIPITVLSQEATNTEIQPQGVTDRNPSADNSVQSITETMTTDNLESALKPAAVQERQESVEGVSAAKLDVAVIEKRKSEQSRLDEGNKSNIAKPAKTKPAAVLGAEKTEIYSSYVKRFVISAAVKQREPVGSIKDIVVDANQIATVYVYSEVHGLKDQYLYYIWKNQQKEIARVEVGVWGDVWRSYSRKYLNQTLRGDFRVELRTGEGELLAETAFQLK